MPESVIGYFQIRIVDSVRYEIRKNQLLSQIYISNFKENRLQKITLNLPWQFMLSKTIDIYLDNNNDYSLFESRVKSEIKPSYIFINNIKVANNGILNLNWSEILGL